MLDVTKCNQTPGIALQHYNAPFHRVAPLLIAPSTSILILRPTLRPTESGLHQPWLRAFPGQALYLGIPKSVCDLPNG